MKIIYFGTDAHSKLVLEKIIKAGNHVCLVITLPDSIRSRGNKKTPTPIKEFCENENIPFKDNIPELNEIKNINPDMIVVASYGKIIPKNILDSPTYGSINLHPSLLPRHRGPSPVQTTLINNEKITGASIILLNEIIDGGPIVLQEKYEIKSEEYYLDLISNLFLIGAKNINKILKEPGLLKKAKLQKETEATYTRKINKSDGHINWNKDAGLINQTIKALSENPGTYSYIDKKKLKIFKVKNFNHNKTSNEPGKLSVGSNNEVIVSALKGTLEIDELQLEGKKRIKAKDFIQGYKIYEEVNNKRIYKILS